MRKKRFCPEEIISKLRETDILLGQGHTEAQVIRSIKFQILHITAGVKSRAALTFFKLKNSKSLKKKILAFVERYQI